jgi:hypothetical protein
MNMDVWYDLLIRELADIDHAKELRQDAEQRAALDDVEDDAPTPPPDGPKGSLTS